MSYFRSPARPDVVYPAKWLQYLAGLCFPPLKFFPYGIPAKVADGFKFSRINKVYYAGAYCFGDVESDGVFFGFPFCHFHIIY